MTSSGLFNYEDGGLGNLTDEGYKIMEGYGKATLHLVELCSDNFDRNYIIYPAAFLFRHFLELAIKEVYINYKKLNDDIVGRDQVMGHQLVRQEIDELNDWLFEEYGDSIPESVMNTLQELNDVDVNGHDKIGINGHEK